MLNLKRKAIAIAILAIPAALASTQSSSAAFRTVVNPDDSGYSGPVEMDNTYQNKTIAAPSDFSDSRFRVVVNPDDSGYRGPVALDNAYQDKTTVAASTLSSSTSRMVGASEWSGLVQQGYFGTPAQNRPDSTIKVGSATNNVAVDHFATAKIENDKGQSFIWRFDGIIPMSQFPLKLIAPSGFDTGNTQVSVLHPALHTAP